MGAGPNANGVPNPPAGAMRASGHDMIGPLETVSDPGWTQAQTGDWKRQARALSWSSRNGMHDPVPQ